MSHGPSGRACCAETSAASVEATPSTASTKSAGRSFAMAPILPQGAEAPAPPQHADASARGDDQESDWRSPMRFLARVVLVVCSLVPAAGISAQQPAAPQRGIVNVTGQLYRAQNNNHYTVFLVTPEGVIMSDPINRDFARWLKAEIAARFKVPVRYVLYTHRDWDHASGGVVFADTAEFVGHRNMLAALAPPAGNPPLTQADAALDTNRNGLIERAEAKDNSTIAQQFDHLDYNRDDVVSAA